MGMWSVERLDWRGFLSVAPFTGTSTFKSFDGTQQELITRGFSLDGISVGTKSVIGSNDTTQKRAMVDTGVSHAVISFTGIY
jgi:hypothetical protein